MSVFRQTFVGREWKFDVGIRWVALFLLVDILDPYSCAALSKKRGYNQVRGHKTNNNRDQMANGLPEQ